MARGFELRILISDRPLSRPELTRWHDLSLGHGIIDYVVEPVSDGGARSLRSEFTDQVLQSRRAAGRS